MWLKCADYIKTNPPQWLLQIKSVNKGISMCSINQNWNNIQNWIRAFRKIRKVLNVECWIYN